MSSKVSKTAGPSFTQTDAVCQLQSHEQAELLDAIDGLRSADVGADISIPQIVVCGDQSSGKSSVLEAIAQVRFPLGSGTTTCFPIEVILRKEKKRGINVKLRPATDRKTEEASHLAKFVSAYKDPGHEDFPAIVQEATDYLKAFEPGRRFWNDTLCAEVAGPNQPHLTLVDLPGLIHFQGQNAEMQDRERIEAMVRQHFNNNRTIVLAVVSATYDLELQRIMTLIEQAGAAKGRTLGVITKPDRVVPDSDEEKKRIHMAGNGPLQLGRGWHVLVNLPHEDKDRSADHRDELERAFFAKGAWSHLPPEDVGISSLRYKLSRSLLDCIIQDLPRLMAEMQRELEICTRRLTGLGNIRETIDDKREYLQGVLSRLQRLVEASLDGDYRKAEFATFFDGAPNKRLRDVITKESATFAAHIRSDGKQFKIYDKPAQTRQSQSSLFAPPTTQDPDLGLGKAPNFDHPYIPDLAGGARVWSIHIMRYCTALENRIKETRGKNLPGILSENTIQDIFRQQSVFWGPITREHVDRCFGMTFNFVKTAVLHAAGNHTGLKLMQHFINEKFDQKSEVLDQKVNELLWPYLECHPMTYNLNYEAKTNADAKATKTGETGSEKPRQSWTEIVMSMSFGSELIPAARALDRTEIYYDIALDNLIENVASLAIERCLLHDLRSLIQPQTMWRWSEEKLAEIASEPGDAQRERQRLRAKVAALDSAVQTCKRHMRQINDVNVTAIQQPLKPHVELHRAEPFSTSSSPSHHEQGGTRTENRRRATSTAAQPARHSAFNCGNPIFDFDAAAAAAAATSVFGHQTAIDAAASGFGAGATQPTKIAVAS
nr:interferon-induced gtp-binding protein mx [Quercus suber]